MCVPEERYLPVRTPYWGRTPDEEIRSEPKFDAEPSRIQPGPPDPKKNTKNQLLIQQQDHDRVYLVTIPLTTTAPWTRWPRSSHSHRQPSRSSILTTAGNRTGFWPFECRPMPVTIRSGGRGEAAGRGSARVGGRGEGKWGRTRRVPAVARVAHELERVVQRHAVQIDRVRVRDPPLAHHRAHPSALPHLGQSTHLASLLGPVPRRAPIAPRAFLEVARGGPKGRVALRSEEHTSEL